MINLFNEMQKIVNKKMKSYQSDLNIDKDMIIRQESDKYIWYVKESGTHLIKMHDVTLKGTYANTVANHMLEQVEVIYAINVNKRGTKYAYGSIKRISQNKMKKILNSARKMNDKDKAKYIVDILEERKDKLSEKDFKIAFLSLCRGLGYDPCIVDNVRLGSKFIDKEYILNYCRAV